VLLVATQLLKAGSKAHGGRRGVVVNHVVERAVNAVVNVQGLGLALAALSRVHLGGNCSASAHEVTARFGDESKFARGFLIHSLFESCNRRADGGSNLLEGRHVGARTSSLVAGETAADVDETHGGHADLVGVLEKLSRVVEGRAVGAFVPTS